VFSRGIGAINTKLVEMKAEELLRVWMNRMRERGERARE